MANAKEMTARVSSKGQIAIPKPIRDRLGLRQGTDLAVRVEGPKVVMRKIDHPSWRQWRGRLKGAPLLQDRARERRREIRRDEESS